MNRNHWLGAGESCTEPPTWGLGTPLKPHSSDRVQLATDEVELGQGQNIVSFAFCTPSTFFMHGSNRAPMLIWTYGEGPIMGLKVGLVSIGDPVSWAAMNKRVSQSPFRCWEAWVSPNIHRVRGETLPLFTSSTMKTTI